MNEKEMQEKADNIENYASNHDTYGLYNLANELIAEVRRLKERNAQITQNYNKRVEKYYYLQQEVRRLRKPLIVSSTIKKLADENKLYKDLYTKANTQNMKYRLALIGARNQLNKHNDWEELSQYIGFIIDRALEGDTNE